ncbi:ABC transporter substrate-binding protein [Flexivirga sp. B27]
MKPTRKVSVLTVPVIAALAIASLSGCSRRADAAGTPSSASGGGSPAKTLRLGYFPNVTHAVPVLGVADGEFAEELGATKLTTQTFNAGPAATEALLGGSVDAVYLGPNPAINAFAKTGGKDVRIVAGGASGGAALVVRPGIKSVAQLAGKTLASPQLANTQDVALKYFLKKNGFSVNGDGNGSGSKKVDVVAQDNAQSLQLFREGRIDGAWLPEPWATRLVKQGGGKVLVDEKSQWPKGRFVTTNLLVSTKFLAEHPQTVRALIAGQVKTAQRITQDPTGSAKRIDAALTKLNGKALPTGVTAAALRNLTPGWNPYAASLHGTAQHAESIGLLKKTDLHGIYDLSIVNSVLKAQGLQTVSDAGLGQE